MFNYKRSVRGTAAEHCEEEEDIVRDIVNCLVETTTFISIGLTAFSTQYDNDKK